MGALFILCGALFIMYGFICVVGENLQKDLGLGVLALFTYPVFVFYYATCVDYKRGWLPMYTTVGGILLLIVGKLVGIN
jgi:hypothetical protein